MALRDLGLKRRYRTGRDDLVSDFYLPCLSEADSYDRAVGYFTSGSLALSAQGLNRMIDKGGLVRLVASPRLQPEDIKALQAGMAARQDVVRKALLRELVKLNSPAQQRRLEYVAWMLAEGSLEIKVAMLRELRNGIFHEKFGVIRGGVDALGFSGSANETEMAMVGNFESFHVYRSWVDHESDWVQELVDDFEALWLNSTPELEVVDLPEAIREGLLQAAPRDWIAPPPDLDQPGASRPATDGYPLGVLEAPTDFQIRDYQLDAIRAWFDNGGRGIFEMATGTGKTVTALTLATRLREGLANQHGLPLFLLVVCPRLNLVTQWARELRRFGVNAILASENSKRWRADLLETVEGVRSGAVRFAAVVVTNDTLAGAAFAPSLARMPEDTLVIADEVHNLGTQRLADALPGQVRYRLGLSATPQRWLDGPGTTRIEQYFGPPIFEFGLDRAIADGFLCPYHYYPVVVELTDDERHEYLEVSARIAALVARGDGSELAADDSEGLLKALLFKRARLVGAAANKVPAALAAVAGHARQSHVIVYCSDSAAFGDPENRQMDLMLGGMNLPPLSMTAARYTFRESPVQRRTLETEFEDGSIQALVAIRCLDEGVDIPAMQTAVIMASTTNPRQFIQRRGRVLRRHPGKESATIYDLLVSPGDPSSLPDEVFNIERRLFRKELTRVIEFAKSAENGVEAMHGLLPLREEWNCLDV